MISSKDANKILSEGKQIEIFAKLFNEKYNTDYFVGQPLPQNSITDRELLSKSSNYPKLFIQLKEVKEFDTSYFTKQIMGSAKVFDNNIFKLLIPLIKEANIKYGNSATDIILVLNVGVSEEWLKDFICQYTIPFSIFKGIYCISLPSNLNPNGYIFPLKELVN